MSVSLRLISKMDYNIFFGIAIFASGITFTTSSSCEMKNYKSSCNYEVKCVTNSGSISNPSCEKEPNVTFTVVNSNLNYLTAGFFASTNFDSRVRQINGVNNSWNTIDTTAFRYYSKCLNIDISKNNIVNINNDAFRGLTNLRFLNISHNSIESFSPRSFFISELKHTDLKQLDLSNNKLQAIGNELTNVPNLDSLYLQNNQLSSLSDDAFINLKSLKTLYLQNNLLKSVNLSLIHLQNLQNLDLSYNHIKKILSYQVDRLRAIVNFNISHNGLLEVGHNCFVGASDLAQADFSFNEIQTPIESNMFLNDIQLKYLNFYNNKIVRLEDSVFINHNRLTYLNLQNNNITGNITEFTFANLRHLPQLDLSQQSFIAIQNNAFQELDNLRILNISKNIIESVAKFAFVDALSITVLDLSYNKIPNLLFLKNTLPNLTELYINNNNIITLLENTLTDQTKLKTIDLSMNNIIIFEENSLPLYNLQYLNIVGNKINAAIGPKVFSPAKYLRFLDLSYFNISGIHRLAFDGLPVVAKLNLSNNVIDAIEEDSFEGVDNLYSLDISYNKLKYFNINSSKLPNLRALHLRNNKLENVSSIFSNRSKISYIDLSNNNITNISGLDGNILPNLTVLYLNNNKIQLFNNVQTNSLATLIDLGLSSNEISEIKLYYFKELMSVDLSNNNLTNINKAMLEENEYLQSLDISRNKITDLPPGTFQFMKNLKFVNLSSNYLSKLRYGSLKGLHKTEILDISKNIISYLDVDVFHECEELKTLIIDYNRIKTFDVERLILFSAKKLRILSLGGNPILCREIVHSIKSVNVTFYAVRQVEVTSVDKIYHEDNVHGIKCGDEPIPDTDTTTKINPTLGQQGNVNKEISSSTTIALVWCSILTVLLVFGGLILYRKRFFSFYLSRHRGTHHASDSIYQSDLLG